MKPLVASLTLALLLAVGGAGAAQAESARIVLLDIQSMVDRGQQEQALALLDRILADPANGPDIRALALAQRGNIEYRHKAYPAALADFEQALGLDPNSVQALRGSCYALLQMRRTVEAGPRCQAAAAEAKALSTAMSADILGYYGLMSRDYGMALMQLNTAIQADPTYAPAYLHRGMVYQAQKNDVAARADFLKARELWPQDREIEQALRQLGLIF